MNSALDRYLKHGSPFLPEVELALLDPIIRDLFLEQGYYMGESIGNGLIQGMALSSALEAIFRRSGKYAATSQDLVEYAQGFLRPLRLLQVAYAGVEDGLEAARGMLSTDDVERDFLLENILLAVDLVRADSSGIKLMNQVVQNELGRATNLYYGVGLEAARRMFMNYSEIIETIVPCPEKEEKEKAGPFLASLFEYEKTAPVSSESLLGETEQLETSREIPHRPYPSEYFVRDVQRIRDLKKRAASRTSAADKLFEAWKQLTEQPGLQEYSALWTVIHIAFGDFAERRFVLTRKNRFIRAARWAYSAPLKKLSIWKTDLGTRCMCAARLGELYCKFGCDLEMSALELARATYDVYWDLLRSNERLYQRSPFPESKQSLQARINIAVARIIESCAYLGDRRVTESANWRRLAFMIAENGKSRMLREEMALAERVPPVEIPFALCDAERRCLDRLHEIHAELATHRRGWFRLGEISKKRNELRLELEQAWSQMEDYGDAAHEYVSVRRDEAIQWGDLRWNIFQGVAERLGERFALISMSRLPDAVFLSVLRAGWDAPKVRVVPLPRSKMLHYLHVYDTEILNRYEVDQPTNEWQELGEQLFAPLETLLADVNSLYFLPHGPFYHLPLHALTIGGRPVIERWGVAYVPSVTVLESTLSRPRDQGAVLVLGCASPDDSTKLTESILEEASRVANHFHALPVLSENAGAGILRERAPSSRLIHLSCHGWFDSEDPLNSGIDLVDGRFSARDWLRLKLRANLVTLSACQTGISKVRLGDDLVGLTWAILFAGASSLLTALWTVNARTTRDWMIEFYRNTWDEDGRQVADKVTAFRRATLNLRKDYADPYYWAPFILVGNFQ